MACVLCAIPILAATYPPMVDIPQHAAQIAGLKGTLDGTWKHADQFDLRLFNPYWLGYSLVLVLSSMVGIVWAIKLVVAAAACAFPLTAARFANSAGADPRLNWMFLILPFGFAYDWGFLNFLVALPFGFLFLRSALEGARAEDKGRWIRIALWLHFLFFAHVLVTAVFCVLAILILASPWGGTREWIRRCLPLASILPLTAVWALSLAGSAEQNLSVTFWDLGFHRLASLPPMMVASSPTASGYMLAAAALALPLLLGARPSTSITRWLPFIFYLAWMLFFAHHIFGNSFTFHRFGIIGLPLYYIGFQCVGVRPSARIQRLVYCGAILLSIAALGEKSARSIMFNREVDDYREVIAHAAHEGRMMMLILDRSSASSSAPVFLHFPAWYQAEHGGLVEFSFSRFDVTPLAFRDRDASAVHPGFEWSPHSLNWRQHKGYLYDYVIVRSQHDESEPLSRISGGRTALVAKSGKWQLYTTRDSGPYARQGSE